ncbi:hypothetical protein SAMN05446935_0333 [Burkholderia sp. YR290]|nr:hypothetical protein SAMN05446935_0333 [Burkholderia sp. YR290]
MDYTFNLTAGGAQVFRNGVLFFDQPFTPGDAGHTPMSAEDATNWAQAFIANEQANEQGTAG